MVMAIRHGVLPRTLHVDEPSTHVDWEAGAVELLTEQIDWPQLGRLRRAGVSSFGISGTNAHVILEQASSIEQYVPVVGVDSPVTQGVVPLVLSAKTEPALRAQAARLLSVVREGAGLGDLGLSLATGRSSFEHRAVVL